MEEFPIQKPEGEGKMTNEAAKEEADMMRAKMSESLGREPTAEDYDQTLKAVEELKELAEEEPSVKKLLYMLGRLPVGTLNMVTTIIHYIATGETIPPIKFENTLEDAAYKLKKLKEDAEIFKYKE